VTKKDPPSDPFLEAVHDIADAQIRAAQVRFRPADPSAEKPSEVTKEFVERFAVALGDALGPTRLVASRREVLVERGDLSFFCRFQASTNNTAGATIVLWPHAGVQSASLKRWRRDKPWPVNHGKSHRAARPNDGVFIQAMLGNFFVPPRYIALELVEADKRQELLEGLVADCRAVDSRLQRDLDSREAFIAYASRADSELECSGDAACEYIAASWGMDAVKNYARRALTDAQVRATFDEHLAEVSRNPDTRARPSFRLDRIARFFFAHRMTLD
jgi:hypothetical protein